MKKVVITGASGLLGRAVNAEFSKNSWTILALGFSRGTTLVKVDLNNHELVENIISEFKPDAIIHCAAQRSPEKVEHNLEESRKLNVHSSKMLAELAEKLSAVFIYISTDYVFDGENPPYAEFDEPNPLNLYGLTKYEGEKEVLRVNPGSCVLRIPVLYGGEEEKKDSAVACLINNLLDTKPSRISSYEIRFPSHTKDIAKVCFQMVVKKLEDPSMNSVFHWCGSEPFTKYEMVRTIADVFNVPHAHITPDNNPGTGIARPRNVQLSCERLQAMGIGHHTLFRDGVHESFSRFFK